MRQYPTFRARADARNAAGLCVNCNAPPAPGRLYCAHCTQVRYESLQRTREARKRKGLCAWCGRSKEPDSDAALCPGCRQKRKDYRQKRKEPIHDQG